MAHHIYHTRGIILESGPSGESNRYYKVFTEELGLIGATAQAVREGKSKLRYVLQDSALVHLDVVRGKEMWRITSAVEERAQDFSKSENQRKLFSRACALYIRLLQGEGREPELFDDLHGLAVFLNEATVPREQLPTLEALVAFRALVGLGYIDRKGYEDHLSYGAFSLEVISKFGVVLPKAMQLLNTALVSSHL